MSSRNWLRSWLSNHSRTPDPRARSRLAVEHLEDRLAPAHLVLSGTLTYSLQYSADADWGYYSDSASDTVPITGYITGNSVYVGVTGVVAETQAGFLDFDTTNAVGVVFITHALVQGYYPGLHSGNAAANATVSGTIMVEPDAGENIDDPVTVTLEWGFFGWNFVGDHQGGPDSSSSYSNSYTVGSLTGAFYLDSLPPPAATFPATIGEAIPFTLSATTTETVGEESVGDVYVSLDPAFTVETVLPDLATDPASGLTLSANGSGIDYTYSVLHSAPGNGVPVGFYWATGPSQAAIISNIPAAFSTILTGADAAVNDPTTPHTKHLTWADLGTRPASATHLVMVLDPDRAVAESAETNNVATVALPGGGVIRVEARDDANGPDDGYGTYLSGVPLNKVKFFTADTEGPNVKTVRLKIVGQAAVTKPVDSNGTAFFNFDPSTLKAGDYTLTAVALDANGQKLGQAYSRNIHVTDRVGLRLQANVPGTGLVDAKDLRLVAGVSSAPTLDFTATVSNLPLPKVYKDKLAVRFYDAATNAQQFVGFMHLDGTGTAQFSVPTGRFGNTVTGSAKFDYDAFVTPAAVGLASPKRLSVKSEPTPHLFVIARPGWLGEGTTSFTDSDEIHFALGDGQVGYAFSVAIPVVNVNLPAPQVAGGLFAGLTSSLRSDINMDLFAKLVGGGLDDAKFGILNWDAKAVFLGETVFEKKLAPKDAGLKVTGSLADTRMLKGIGTLTIATETPVDLLKILKDNHLPSSVDWTFGKDGEKNKKWAISGNVGPLSATFHLDGRLKAEIEQLDASASLTFNVANGTLHLVKKDSSGALDTRAGSEITLTGGVAVGITIPIPFIKLVADEVPTFDVFTASLRGTLTPEFEASLRVKLSDLTHLETSASRAGIEMGYKLEYATEWFEGKPKEDSYKPFADDTLGPVALFELALPDDMEP